MFALNQILNYISISLLLPVMALLLLFLGFAVWKLGGFFSMYHTMIRERRTAPAIIAAVRAGALPDTTMKGKLAASIRHFSSLDWNELDCEKALSELEFSGERDLEQSRVLMKAGPMLGLMGTLIPMGPALAGLAAGDVASMALNMQIAFATTVVGILIAGVGLMLYSVKRHWYAKEISDLRYCLDLELSRRGATK